MTVENALTIHQPWAWAISARELPMLPGFDPVPPKGIENRTRRPWGFAVGEPLAIHAGLKFDQEGADFMTELGIDLPFGDPKDWPRGILSVATLAGASSSGPCEGSPQAVWYTGPVAWILRDIRRLAEPIQARGQQGIWKIKRELGERIGRELAP